ncbi:MAG: exodeoxyribonuclease VII large subunit, partial [Planctomycetota bacterium]
MRRKASARRASRAESTESTESAGAAQPRVLSVGSLTRAIGERLQGLGRLAVEGELVGVKRAGSGHVYFSLKDENAVVNCAIWRSRVASAARFDLRDGMRVVCHGKLDVYAPRGSYSLIIERVEQRGIGELLARLEELKTKLRERGWFDRSRPLPSLPRCVGLVTSRQSDAFQDFLRTRSLRWPLYPLRLCSSRVQGKGAAQEVAEAIARLDASGVDVICVVRGGGSLEDLWCFNELPVAEAIHACSVPVVTGVGHETDVTLADLVADHRAHTPTDAAQTVIPDRAAMQAQLERAAGYLAEAVDRALSRREERLTRLISARTLRGAGWILDERARSIQHLGRRLIATGDRRAERAGAQLERAASRLASQSPALALASAQGRLSVMVPRLVRGAAAPIEARGERL